MRVFKTRQLDRFAKKERIADHALWEAAKDVAAGKAEAALGRFLFKKRVARSGEGKRSGFRTIVAFKSEDGDKLFFLYGFAKNQRSNITSKELYGLGAIAEHYLKASQEVLQKLLHAGEIVEIREVQDNERHP